MRRLVEEKDRDRTSKSQKIATFACVGAELDMAEDSSDGDEKKGKKGGESIR